MVIVEPNKKTRSDKGKKRGPNSKIRSDKGLPRLKVRSDKGVKRGPNNIVRSDKGLKRTTSQGVPKEDLAIYSRVKSRMLNQTIIPVNTDLNQIFIPTTTPNEKQQGDFSIVYRGQLLKRTVRTRTGYTVDLEQYRFAALQSLLSNPATDKVREIFKYEFEQFNVDNTFNLFCQLYHIKPEDSIRWSYKDWRREYTIVYDPDQQLAPTFTFEYGKKIGIDYLVTEYQETISQRQAALREQLIKSKNFINYKSRVTDEITTDYLTPIRNQLLLDSQYISSDNSAINRVARSLMYRKYGNEISQKINDVLENWLENKIKEIL